MAIDRSQFPLLEEITEVFLDEAAIAKRDLRPPPELDAGTQSLLPSLELEVLAEVGALIYPGRVVLKMRDIKWSDAPRRLPSGARLVGRARKEADGVVSVTLSAESVSTAIESDTGPVSIPVCRAQMSFGHVYQSAVRPIAAQQVGPGTRPEELHNGRWLYFLDAQQTVRVPAVLQIIDWAQLDGLGRMQGEMIYPSQVIEGIPPDRFQLAPPALDGALQMAHWLWYAFAGESSRVMGIDEATWYRLPRRDERVLCEAQLKGTAQSMVIFDVGLYGSDGAPLMELRRLRVTSAPEPSAPPRLAWQSFLKRLTQP